MEFQDFSTEELLRIRDSFINRIRTFYTYINDLNQQLENGVELTGSLLKELIMRVDKIEPLYTQFDEIATRLEKASTDGRRTLFEDTYFSALATAKDILDRQN
ncbi:hypothetical protein PYW08_008281 [Mythimna loreyi]|uniref:Uncharacterized protein n=1 Tax=Mythimna loreyi TaxID=667449 RepID=A0ACC2QC44_9NEOP|nr:hypothetical protein PYW08_008281 [Mythimna loreyi]